MVGPRPRRWASPADPHGGGRHEATGKHETASKKLTCDTPRPGANDCRWSAWSLCQTRAVPAWGRITRYGAAALAVGAVGAVLRLWLILSDTPPTNSDEATMGLAALHIGQGRALPVFFYGQHYMGTLEAYLAAPLVALAGPSVVVLRIPTLSLYVALLIGSYHLSRRLFTPGFAVATVGLLAFAADRTVKNQLIAGGGYPEGGPAAVALMLLAVWLGAASRPARASLRRLLAFAAWGFVAGLLLWNHWLGVPYLAAAAIVLAVGVGRELLGRAGLITLGGLAFGAAPLLAHNLRTPLAESSPMVFRQLYGMGDAVVGASQAFGRVLQGIPLGVGLCAPSHCTLWQLWWAPALLLIAGIAAVGYARAALHASGADRVREVARLALVVAALATVLSYARSPAAALSPVESARYLSLVVVSMPAMLWPLWRWATTNTGALSSPLRGARRFAGALPLAALTVTLAAATGSLIAQMSTYAEQADRRHELLTALRQHGVTRFYTEYWSCNWVAFATAEDTVCAVLTDDLRPGVNRVPGYRAAVADAIEPPAYVAPVPSRFDRAVRRHLTGAGVPFAVDELAGYRVYRPTTHVTPPLG